MSQVTIGGQIYNSLSSGFWVRQDGSGPYTVDVAAGTAAIVGAAGNPAGVVTIALTSSGETYQGNFPISAPATRLKNRYSLRVCNGSQRFKLGFANKNMTTSGEANGPGNIGIRKVAAEVNGVTIPVYFSGVRTLTLVPGDVDKLSDWVELPVKPGDTLYIREEFDMTAAGYVTSYKTKGDQSWVYDPVNEVDDVDSTGVMTAPSGAGGTFPYHPILVIGEVAAGTIAVVGVADSIGEGLADLGQDPSLLSERGSGGGGYLRRAFWQMGIAYTAFSQSGRTLAASTGASTLLDSILKYHTHMIQALVTNDIQSASVATMQGNLGTVWGKGRSLLTGQKMVLQATILPRVSSTDGTTTTANQTPLTGYAVGDKRDQLQNYIYEQLALGSISGILDVSKVVEDNSTSSKWAPLTFATTLAAIAASNASSVSLVALPPIAASLSFDPGGVNNSNGFAIVRSVTGTSTPYTAALNGSPGVAQVISAAVKETPTIDGTHPGGTRNISMANKVISDFPRG